MKKTSSFVLMLKQGFKGVFKFKIQFIIIIILAFISTLILSVTFSTQEKIKDSYNKVVLPVKKFDFSGTTRIESNVDNPNDHFMLSNLVNVNAYNHISVTSGNDIPVNDYNYNYVMYNPNGAYKDVNGHAYKSFLTKGTELFIQKQSGDISWGWSGYFSSFQYYLFSLFQELSDISNAKNNNLPLSSLKDDTDTIYSPIGIYTYNHPFWFKRSVVLGDKDSGEFSKFVMDESDPNENILITIVGAVSSFSSFLSNNINLFNRVNKDYKITTNSQAIEFLFGKKMDGVAMPNGSKWITDENGSYSLDVNLNVDNKNISDYNLATPKESSATDTKILGDSAIWENGLRGITSPFINMSKTLADTGASVEQQYESVYSYSKYGPMDINDPTGNDGKSLFSSMQMSGSWFKTALTGSFYSDGSTFRNKFYAISNGENPSRIVEPEVLYRTYNLIAAESAGFIYKTRRESDYFDSITQLKFRAIAIDDREDYNLTIFKGRKPASGEILINEQFAKKNHVKVGETVKIGDAIYPIAGLATDALTYVPSQDIDVPVPNPAASAIIYASQPTIHKMISGSKTGGENNNAIDASLIYFLTQTNNNNLSLENKKTLFNALLSNDTDGLDNNFNVLKQFVNGDEITTNAKTHIHIDSFDKSMFKFSWTLEPTVMKAYDTVVFAAAGIIALICIISLVISVKKTIDFNSKQIGILKAMGYKPSTISVTYISNSLIIMFAVIPIAWIIGVLLQLPFGNLFSNYFSIQPDNIIWEWRSITIALLALGAVSIIASFIAAYVLTNKNILSILYSSVKWGHIRLIDWMKNTIFKRSRFSTRFSMILTSSGSRQIILLSVVTLIASFLISLMMAIPSVAVKTKNSYYGAIKYANKYDEVPMMSNAPLSKNAITYWNGQDYLDNEYVKSDLKFDDTGNGYGYYKKAIDYTASIANSDVIPQYVYNYDKKDIENYDLYIMKNIDQIITLMGNIGGNNVYTLNGMSLSIGDFDKFYGILLHSYGDEFSKNADANKTINDEAKIKVARNLSNRFTTSLPQIITAAIDAFAPGMINSGDLSGKTWKQQILVPLYSALPPYIRGYVEKSPSREDQFGFSFQNEIYIPGQETLTTNLTDDNAIVRNKKKAVSITGIDKNQNSINFDDEYIDKLYLPKDVKAKIYNVLNVPIKNGSVDGDILNKSITYNGQTLYNGQTHALTLPVLPNMQAQSAFDLKPGKVLANFQNNSELLQFSSDGKYYNLPASAWIYDDTDFANYVTNNQNELARSFNGIPYRNDPIYQSENPNGNWIYERVGNSYYLDPTKIDNGKLTHNKEFNISDSIDLNKGAYLFKDFMFNKDGIPDGTYMRPYYQYKNFKLMMPEGWVDKDNLLWNDGYTHTSNQDSETTQWYKELSANDVPKSVKDGYIKLQSSSNGLLSKEALSGNWIAISPYDFNYYADNYDDQINEGSQYLLDAPSYWYRWFLKGNSIFKISNNVNTSQLLASQGAASDITINFKSIGGINSYSDKLVAMDSDLANALAGFSNSRSYQYNYDVFNPDTYVPAGKEIDGVKSQFDRWKPYTGQQLSSSDFLVNKWNGKIDKKDLWEPSYYALNDGTNILDYAPHNYYNGKLSNIDEPLNMTSVISFTTKTRIGQVSLRLKNATSGNPTPIVNKALLLSTVKALIDEIMVIVISICSMLIAAIIVTAALITMLTGDIYIEQYKRFMILLRATGYSNAQIITYSFGTVSIMSCVAWILGTVGAWAIIYWAIRILWTAGIALPVGLAWWPIVISLAVVAISFVGSLWVSSRKVRTINPSLVLTETAE